MDMIKTTQEHIDELREKQEVGLAVKYTLDTPGWKDYIEPMLGKLTQKINSVEDVKDETDLKARQEAIKLLKLLQKELFAFIDDANSATVELERLDTL